MATRSSILAWRIPIDRGAWRATVHGVTDSWTQLSIYSIWGSGMEIREVGVQNGYRVVAFRFHLGIREQRFLRSLGVLVVMGSLMRSVCRTERWGSLEAFCRSGGGEVLWGLLQSQMVMGVSEGLFGSDESL